MTEPFAILVDIDGPGSHPAAGTVTQADPVALLSAREVASAVRAAERAGFTAVTFEDHPQPAYGAPAARVDAVIRAAFSAPLTGSIGLVPVVHSIYNEPFHLATQLSTLDTASLGRAGWIAVADPDPAIASRYGRAPLGGDDADEELSDVVEAVRRLWDSWEDDAVIRDVASGRYLDRDKLHYADFAGHRFSVKGPSLIPRSPGGQPPVFAAAGTAAEIDVALIDIAREAGATFVGAVEEAAGTARSWHDRGARVVVQLEVVLDRAGETGAERLRDLDDHAPWRGDLHARYVGDAPGLVQLLTSLAGVVDGVRILPAVLRADLEEIGRAVLPALRDRGVFASPRPGGTLRHSLGLPHPVNRYLEAAR